MGSRSDARNLVLSGSAEKIRNGNIGKGTSRCSIASRPALPLLLTRGGAALISDGRGKAAESQLFRD